jgi:hypothetical protein
MPNNSDVLISLAKGVFSDLTEAEESFFRLNAIGNYPVFGDGSSDLDKPEEADEWGPERTIRADCLRWLCLAQAARPLILGIRLRAVGAKIQGLLQLDYSLIPFVLAFDRSCFTDRITFEKSRLVGLEITGTRLKKSIYAAGLGVSGSVQIWNESVVEGQLFFDGATISGDLRCDNSVLIYKKWPEDLRLNEPADEAFRGAGLDVKGFVSFVGSTVEGGVCLYEASIGSGLRCEGANFTNPGKTALSCTGVKIGGAVFLDRQFIAKGTVDLNFANIGGDVTCENSQFEQTIKDLDAMAPRPALSLDYAHVNGSVVLTNRFNSNGRVTLQGATVGGHLDCQGGRFLNVEPHAILGNNAKVSGGVLLRDGFHSEGTVRFFGTTVGGNIECNGDFWPSSDNIALDFERLEARGHVLFGTRVALKGIVKFYSATISGDVRFVGGTAKIESGNSVELTRASVKGSVVFRDNFTAQGTVSLVGTTIDGNFECFESGFSSPFDSETRIGQKSYALHADFVKVSGTVLMGSLVANGGVSLAYARIGGNLRCLGCATAREWSDLFSLEGAQLDGDLLLGNLDLGKGALTLQRLRVKGALTLSDFVCPEELISLDLRFASVTTIDHYFTAWPKSGSLFLDGFEYSLFGPGFPIRQCIQWLRLNQPRPLRLQPYEQAARILKSSGYESESTQILISKADDLCRHGELSWSGRLISRSLGLAIGHGYRPHRALIFMLYIIFFGAAVFHDGKRNGLISKTNTSVIKSNYPKFQPFIYSIDTFLPIVELGQKSYWAPNANSGFQAKFSLIEFKFTWGSALRVYLWLHILLGWFFTTLWVAGFTGLVRKLN